MTLSSPEQIKLPADEFLTACRPPLMAHCQETHHLNGESFVTYRLATWSCVLLLHAMCMKGRQCAEVGCVWFCAHFEACVAVCKHASIVCVCVCICVCIKDHSWTQSRQESRSCFVCNMFLLYGGTTFSISSMYSMLEKSDMLQGGCQSIYHFNQAEVVLGPWEVVLFSCPLQGPDLVWADDCEIFKCPTAEHLIWAVILMSLKHFLCKRQLRSFAATKDTWGGW